MRGQRDCCWDNCFIPTESTTSSWSARRRIMCSAASAPACLKKERWRCSMKSAPAQRAHREGLIHHGVELAFGGARHRIDMHASTGKTVMIYGQTEVTLDLMNARKAAGLTTIYQAADVKPHDFDTDHPRVSYRQGRRRRTRSPAISSPAATASTASAAPACQPSAIADLRTGLSVRLARHPVGDAAGLARTDLRQPRQRGFALCTHALDPPQPLLRAVSARRPHRAMAGRARSGTN